MPSTLLLFTRTHDPVSIQVLALILCRLSILGPETGTFVGVGFASLALLKMGVAIFAAVGRDDAVLLNDLLPDNGIERGMGSHSQE